MSFLKGNIPSVAVLGVGYLGRFHAQKYASLPKDQVEFLGVFDQSRERAATVALELGIQALGSLRDVFSKADAVVIATPTSFHYELAKQSLENGCHVFIEKPMTEMASQGFELCKIAKEKNRNIQIGHSERFNPAFQKFLELSSKKIQSLEIRRLAPFKPRALDVDVISDLLVHDLDLLFALKGTAIKSFRSQGGAQITQGIDEIRAQFEFEDGSRALLECSRINPFAERRLRAVEENSVFEVDLHLGKIQKTFWKKGEDPLQSFQTQIFESEKKDALLQEAVEFIQSLKQQRQPMINGDHGALVVEWAERLRETIS